MWLRDVKHQHELTEPSDLEAHGEGDGSFDGGYQDICLTKAESANLKEAEQALQRELALGVRHIDPEEYSEERIAGLLAQANRNKTYKRKRRKN